MRYAKYKRLTVVLCCLCICVVTVFPGCSRAEQICSDGCSHVFATIEEASYRIDASMSLIAPLDDVIYIAIHFTHLQPVNYEVEFFRLYYTESECVEIPFMQNLQTQPIAQSVFAGLIPRYEGFPYGRLVPVISSGQEEEEMNSAEIVWGK